MEEMDPPSSMPRRRIYSVTGRFAPKLVKYIFDVHKRKKILVWHELFVLRKSQIWKIDFPVKNITLTLRQEIIKLFLLRISRLYTKFFFVLYLTRLTLLNCRRQRWASVHALVRGVFRINVWIDQRFGYEPTRIWVRIYCIWVRNDWIRNNRGGLIWWLNYDQRVRMCAKFYFNYSHPGKFEVNTKRDFTQWRQECIHVIIIE